jgi:hypothetical protein
MVYRTVRALCPVCPITRSQCRPGRSRGRRVTVSQDASTAAAGAASGHRPRPATFGQVLVSKEFRALWIAQVQSVAGDQLARVALTLLVYDRARSSFLAAVTFAASGSGPGRASLGAGGSPAPTGGPPAQPSGRSSARCCEDIAACVAIDIDGCSIRHSSLSYEVVVVQTHPGRNLGVS